MKKYGILNSDIARVLSVLGHTDTIVICDAGLPIPQGVERIDLAIKKGSPSFIDVLSEVCDHMEIEQAFLAEEISSHNPSIKTQVIQLCGDIPLDYYSHEEFKRHTKSAHACIRTGEVTPFANIILRAGVVF